MEEAAVLPECQRHSMSEMAPLASSFCPSPPFEHLRAQCLIASSAEAAASHSRVCALCVLSTAEMPTVWSLTLTDKPSARATSLPDLSIVVTHDHAKRLLLQQGQDRDQEIGMISSTLSSSTKRRSTMISLETP